jgi:hypothetical protein
LSCQKPGVRACRPVEHPGRHFKPPIRLRRFQRAAEDNKTILVDGTMNANSTTKPRMMPIKDLAKNGPVGVLKPRCTTKSERIDHWIRMRRSLAKSANRKHQITHHPWRTSSPLRPSLGFRYTQVPTVSFLTCYSVRISDNMQTALAMTLLVLIALGGVLSLRLTTSPHFARRIRWSSAMRSCRRRYRILDTEGCRPSCPGICGAFTNRRGGLLA